MITKVAIVGVQVLDLERALDFYTNRLGFAVHTDAKMGGYR
jgi:catechol 2,3-dioxygenase-like lactoylglutathione lyase family enzyme